jgi:hypothetical protein
VDRSTGPERTYTVSWRNPDGKVTTCTSLTPRIAFARLWSAWRHLGEITVLEVTPEWLTDSSLKTESWPYPIPPPDCEVENSLGTCVVYDKTGFWCDACTLWAEENAALINDAV